MTLNCLHSFCDVCFTALDRESTEGATDYQCSICGPAPLRNRYIVFDRLLQQVLKFYPRLAPCGDTTSGPENLHSHTYNCLPCHRKMAHRQDFYIERAEVENDRLRAAPSRAREETEATTMEATIAGDSDEDTDDIVLYEPY